MENSLHDAHHWIARSQEANAALSSKCQMLTENLTRAYQVRGSTLRLSHAFLTLPSTTTTLLAFYLACLETLTSRCIVMVCNACAYQDTTLTRL